MGIPSRLFVVAFAVALGGVAVAKRAPLPAPDPERGSIAVTLKAKPPAKMGSMHAVQVFFVRLEEGEDPLSAESVIPSNFSRKSQVYLLNARPGRYVAVAAKLEAGGLNTMEYQAYFSEAMIPRTEVVVEPGEMAFMGSYRVKTGTKMKNADTAQAHYFHLLQPGAARKGMLGRALFGGKAVYRAELLSAARDAEAERAFWTLACEKTFAKEPAWKRCAERELVAVK